MKFKMEIEFFYNGEIDPDQMRRMIENALYQMTCVHDTKAVLLEAVRA